MDDFRIRAQDKHIGLHTRTMSFWLWPLSPPKDKTPQLMAEAGFFMAGENIECPYCGGTYKVTQVLQDERSPKTIHKVLFPTCPFG
jgi:hypothetical protein